MKRILALAILTAIAAPALAQSTCPPREYAQYKDDAKTRLGRFSMASTACRMQTRQATFDNIGDTRGSQQCSVEVGKAADALAQSKDRKAVEFLASGCKTDYLAETR